MKFRFKVLNEDIQPNKLEAVLGSFMIKETMAEKGIK